MAVVGHIARWLGDVKEPILLWLPGTRWQVIDPVGNVLDDLNEKEESKGYHDQSAQHVSARFFVGENFVLAESSQVCHDSVAQNEVKGESQPGSKREAIQDLVVAMHTHHHSCVTNAPRVNESNDKQGTADPLGREPRVLWDVLSLA